MLQQDLGTEKKNKACS